jgi:hypothetical protein
MFDASERSLPLLREHRLLLAVLEDAIRTYQRYACASDPRGMEHLSHVEDWFASEDSEWMFSFVAICDALGLEPTYLRGGLRRLRERNRAASDAGAPLQPYCFRRVSGMRHRTARLTGNERGDRRKSALVVVRK